MSAKGIASIKLQIRDNKIKQLQKCKHLGSILTKESAELIHEDTLGSLMIISET